MSIDTQHPEFKKAQPLWLTMNDALEDQSVIHGKGDKYLKKTAGMDNEVTGKSAYEAFLQRARFPAITTAALTGIVGLLFEREAHGAEVTEAVTVTGQNNEELARDLVRAVSSKGRDILVVDSPVDGGVPYICRYAAEALINWKVDDEQKFTLAVLQEEVQKAGEDDEYSHDTETQYRVYRRVDNVCTVTVYVKNSGGVETVQEERVLSTPGNQIPLIAVGSIDNLPAIDPIPMMPVARCAFAYYRKSALHEHGLYLTSQPTPVVTGVSEEQYGKLLQQGIGSSALWHLPDGATAEFLEVSGDSLDKLKDAMQDELNQAETYAVRLTQKTGNAEAAESLRLRAATQHASVYTIANAVSQAVTWAQNLRATWGGLQEPVRFNIQTEFHGSESSETLITALNNAVTANNAPRSAMFELLRRKGLSDKSDDDIEAEILNQGPGADSLFPRAPTEPEPAAA